ncbi:hypothetical protein C9I56_07865 [Paraburkholderia caribensis]|nr:hypothetical protein C9I56_07865 [Paraburkholderia caribensis]
MSAPPRSGFPSRFPAKTGQSLRSFLRSPHGRSGIHTGASFAAYFSAFPATWPGFVACLTGNAFALCEGRYPRLAPLRGPFTVFSIRGIT